MIKLSFLRGGAKNSLGLLLIAAVSFYPASAQDVAKNQILQNKTDQQDVRLHTAAVATQIQSLIDELAANGISGDDIKVLNATKAALTNLSGPEMEQVIASLQKAGEATSPATSRQNVVKAYAGQKGIILQLHQILQDYEQRQAAYILPGRFKELAARQTETMLTSASVAKATAGKSAGELTSMQQITEQIVQTDQEAISNDAKLAEEQLNKAAQGSTADDATAMQQAQKDMQSGVVQQALSRANDDLKAGQLLKAINEQKIARDELRRIAQDLDPPTNAVDALAANAATLAQLIAEQKNLLDQTNKAVDIKPRVTGLDDKQGALVDEASSLQKDMQSMSATASALVNDAINPRQVSRAALGTPFGGADTFTKAAASQQEAIDKLEEAQNQLQQQLADAQKAAADADKDPLAKLQDLQKQIQTALQQQQQITLQTAQAANASPPNTTATNQVQQQQSQLQQQTSNLQQTSQPLSLTASQQAAQAALAQANQAVSQQIAQVQQQAADPAALAAAANLLQQAQNSVSSAIADTTPQAGSPPPGTSAAAAALAAAAKNAQAAAATTGLPSSAAAAVQQAQTALAQGQQQAAKGDAPGTAKSAFAAQQSLAQAQAALAMAQAGMVAGGVPAPGAPEETPGPDQPGVPSSVPATGLTGGNTQKGTLHDTTGTGKFVTVASRDRAVIDQTQAEKRPQEYGSLIDQYMKNLADQSSSSPP